MNRVEFLEKLRQALEQNVSAQAVRENVEYYNQYISDELRKGRSEQDIMGELGDPWVIARTIIDSEEAKNGGEYIYDSPNAYETAGRREQSYGESSGRSNQYKVFRFDTWWKKLLLAICVVGIICIIFAIISGFVSLVAPILIPVLIIVFLIRLIQNTKRYKSKRPIGELSVF